MSDGTELKALPLPEPDTSNYLKGNVEEKFTTQNPQQPPKCQIHIPNIPLKSMVGKFAKNNRRRLRGTANKAGGGSPLKGLVNTPGGNPNLVPRTPTSAQPAPSEPKKTGISTSGGMPPYDPLHPQMGQYVPPDQRKNLPPGWLVFDDGYLHPDENARPDTADDLIIPSFFGGWILRFFGPAAAEALPVATKIPPQTVEEGEKVWVSITQNGRIIWRQGQTFFKNTKNGYEATLEEAIKDGARHPLPGYFRAGGR